MMITQNMSLDPNIAIPMFAIWIGLMIAGIILFIKKRISYRNGIILYFLSAIFAGFVLGGTPNTIAPIQQILASIKMGSPLQIIIPFLLMLLGLLLTSLFIGRLFCGFACPLGALQEMVSRINYKSDIKSQKHRKKWRLEIPKKYTKTIRWLFFVLIIFLFSIWNIAVIQMLNPFVGFSIIQNPEIHIYSIPVISLMVIMIASIFVYRPWCRLLCPYGALSSLFSRFSKYELSRTDACTNCGLCEKICPTKEAEVNADKSECYFCRRCIEVCPHEALRLQKV
ncbi:MAG: 4Fe-4S binding protein [Candidatus Lokiarchaeota archaeon]|nr:4Fe-4S binding protein [Candidatus Lokiarchaeota archaeon]